MNYSGEKARRRAFAGQPRGVPPSKVPSRNKGEGYVLVFKEGACCRKVFYEGDIVRLANRRVGTVVRKEITYHPGRLIPLLHLSVRVLNRETKLFEEIKVNPRSLELVRGVVMNK